MYCTQCGLLNPAQNAFCWRCGHAMQPVTGEGAVPREQLAFNLPATHEPARPGELEERTAPASPGLVDRPANEPVAVLATNPSPDSEVDVQPPLFPPEPVAHPDSPLTLPVAGAPVGRRRRWGQLLGAGVGAAGFAATVAFAVWGPPLLQGWFSNVAADITLPASPSTLSSGAPTYDSSGGGFLPEPGQPGRSMSIPRIVEAAEGVAVMVIANSGGGTGYGSGLVLREDGYILTNKHVVEDASSLRVSFGNGRRMDATLRWQSKAHDLALLKVEASDLPTASLGDSGKVQLGEEVLAVGYPLGTRVGSRPTVTRGIVSQIQRMRDGTFIQTDAAINPGNSGGPLFNSRGEVVGITTKRAESAAGRPVVGIGWAIPINVARSVIPSLEDLEKH